MMAKVCRRRDRPPGFAHDGRPPAEVAEHGVFDGISFTGIVGAVRQPSYRSSEVDRGLIFSAGTPRPRIHWRFATLMARD